ncbi:ATP-binding protein [Desulfuromonas sp. CSMB_57]|uniref:magnesium chelatase subunit ChlI family protein n=1 Tax=Desulfuromonas sp. CSMB_57 TaxID=2807629 RepID=UPI001CD775F1|nr:ATP-binding protein [Desulfuromonas sp. CSMB_57]
MLQKSRKRCTHPCPCGYLGDSLHQCSCTPIMIQRYRSRLSGPLLDRIDLHVEVPRVAHKELAGSTPAEPSSAIRVRVEAVHEIQRRRLAPFGLYTNSQMQARHIKQFCRPDAAGEKLLEMVVDRLGMSARSYARILKVARTIADLAGEDGIRQPHLAEAIQYRSLDRKA